MEVTKAEDGSGAPGLEVHLTQDEAHAIVAGNVADLVTALRAALDPADSPDRHRSGDLSETSSVLAALFEGRGAPTPSPGGPPSELPPIASLLPPIEHHLDESLQRWTGSRERALYEGPTARVALTRSRFHAEKGIYWFGYHLGWRTFLEAAPDRGYLVLACGRDAIMCVPSGALNVALGSLSFKDAGSGKGWWHLEVEPKGTHLVLRHANLDLTGYRLEA